MPPLHPTLERAITAADEVDDMDALFGEHAQAILNHGITSVRLPELARRLTRPPRPVSPAEHEREAMHVVAAITPAWMSGCIAGALWAREQWPASVVATPTPAGMIRAGVTVDAARGNLDFLGLRACGMSRHDLVGAARKVVVGCRMTPMRECASAWIDGFCMAALAWREAVQE